MGKIENIKSFVDKDFIADFMNASEKELIINKKITSNFMKRIYREAVKKNPILIVGDYDPDGFFGSNILCNYIKLLESRVNNIEIDDSNVQTYYTKREHGYSMPEDIFNSISKKYSLIVFIDTGSDYEYFTKDTKNVLVVDHHPTNKQRLPFIYNPNRNNELSTSAGKVIYDMTMTFEEEMKEYFGKNKVKSHDILKINKMFAGISLCADMAEMSFDNKQFLKESLELMTNNRDKLTWVNSIKSRNITSLDLSFNIINKINSYSRMGKDLKEIESIFKVNIDSKNIRYFLSSNKVKKLFDNLNSTHEERKSVTAILEKEIDKTLSNKYIADKSILVLNIDNEYSGINGLISQNILNKTCKSNIVISFDKKRQCYVGSGRGNIVKNALKEFLEQNKELKEHVLFGGHKMAIGLSINKVVIEKFLKKINSFSFSREIINESKQSNEKFYYCDGVDVFKEALSHYNMLSPTTNIQERYYAIIENYKNLGIVRKKNGWNSSTIKDTKACMNIYFKDDSIEKVLNNEPIVIEITNQNRGNYFLENKEYDDNLLNEHRKQIEAKESGYSKNLNHKEIEKVSLSR